MNTCARHLAPWQWTCLLAFGVLTGGCEVYDPPPEAQLREAEDQVRHEDTPLRFEFTEPIDADSLHITIWPNSLDDEGEIAAEAKALLNACSHLGGAGCESATLSIADDGMSATLDPGALFADVIGEPLWIDVEPGLRDQAGRSRKVRTRFPLLISPRTQAPSEPLDIQMQSGVVLLVADLRELYQGVFLRLYIDLGVAKETGEAWLLGTVAALETDEPPDTYTPSSHGAKLDDEGWVILLKGSVSTTDGERFFLVTETTDVEIMVLGFIQVRLEDLKLEATFKHLASDDGRDTLDGLLSASRALVGSDDDLVEINDGAAVSANVVSRGISNEEIPTGLPRLCDANPCATLDANGGSCELPEPWIPGPECGQDSPAP